MATLANLDEEDDDEFLPLSVIFSDAETLFKRIEANDHGPSGSEHVLKCLELLQKVSQRIRAEGIFSPNEELDDVETRSLRFLLVDYFRGKILARSIAMDGFDPIARLAGLRYLLLTRNVFYFKISEFCSYNHICA